MGLFDSNLPLELIESIVWEVDQLSDLLALSQTCRRARTILHPAYTEYFRISCCLYEGRLWRHLKENTHLLRNVRALTLDENAAKRRVPTIFRDERPEVPSRPNIGPDTEEGIQVDPDLPYEENLIAAMKGMRGLTKLVYRLDPPVHGNEFWNTLWRSCPNLVDVEVADRDEREAHRPPRLQRQQIHNSSFFDLQGLRRLVWYSSSAASEFAISVSLGHLEDNLIERCPDLEELRLQYFSTSHLSVTYGGVLLHRAHWPRLRVLELTRFHAGDEEAVAAFFDRHPLLEILELDQVDHSSGRYVYLDHLSPSALPRLHTFSGGIDNAITILCSGKRPLRSLAGLQFDTSMLGSRRPATWTATNEGRRLLEGLAKADQLEKLSGEFALVLTDSSDLLKLFEACKGLRTLELRCSVAGWLDTYLPAFSRLQHLSHLSFPIHFLSTSTPHPHATLSSMSLRKGGAMSFTGVLKLKARQLAATCPRLERINLAGPGAGAGPGVGAGAGAGVGLGGGRRTGSGAVAGYWAQIIRYTGSDYVSQIDLHEGKGRAWELSAEARELETTRAKARVG